MPVHIGVDVGGTFTDITVSESDSERQILHKLPSTPDRPEQAIVEGLRALLETSGIDAAAIERLSHGTTVGTNALIQRRVGTVGLLTSEGFRDLLEIGRQTRPRVYDIHTDHPKPLVPRELRVEVRERLLADGTVHRELDETALPGLARRLTDAGVDSVVVGFINAYAFPAHEQRAAEVLRAHLPEYIHVVCSSDIFPEFREYERFSTAVLNAALFTVMNAYLDRFERGAVDLGVTVAPQISQSVGGLMSLSMAREIPLRASLSGPAAGVIGAARRAQATGITNLITLDMGGTSADVSLLVDNRPTEVQDRTLAGFPLRMSSLDVNAVGAGGGSIAWIDIDGLLKVGPQSAGASPGPACYGQGGSAATVTDANVVLGRLNGEALLDGTMPIERDLSVRAVDELANTLGMERDETAKGILQVTTAVMVKAVRAISVERGYNPSEFALFAFGGAGPLHATDVARELDIGKVVIPPSPGILCAEGLLHCDLRADFVTTVFRPLTGDNEQLFEQAATDITDKAEHWFRREAVAPLDRDLSWAADLRYVGQNFELTLALQSSQLDQPAIGLLSERFHVAHDVAYGFASPEEPIELVSLRAIATGKLDKPAVTRIDSAQTPGTSPTPAITRDVLFDTERVAAPVYRRPALAAGHELDGPAIVEQLDTTVVIPPGDKGVVDPFGNIVIDIATA